ncbi:MAG: hypothetical protein DDG60_16940, partial [Anaerolineae bacterium]
VAPSAAESASHIRLSASPSAAPSAAESASHIRLSASPSAAESATVHFVQADVFDFIRSHQAQSADLLIAHAFLDLLPLPDSLTALFSLLQPRGLAWLTINFDGVTSIEPAFRLVGTEDTVLSPPTAETVDALIERLYHQTMDTRPSGGDSRTGRHLFGHIKQSGGEIIAAGASDWIVHPLNGQYPAEEAYFLQFILHFFESALSNHPELDPRLLQAWLKQRRAQIERAELIYIAHQIDFLIRRC